MYWNRSSNSCVSFHMMAKLTIVPKLVLLYTQSGSCPNLVAYFSMRERSLKGFSLLTLASLETFSLMSFLGCSGFGAKFLKASFQRLRHVSAKKNLLDE